MDVELYVYDLTRGMARAMSRQLTGIQIDAVYHTALVFGGIEYFFGMGVQTCYPGTTHHGQPMERVNMGTTHLPLEVILEYLESLKEIYTPESYDLFAHNCNNFTNDFAQFLVGRGIPEHITNLPRRVLDTPFGQMLRPQIDAGMRAVTQAPVPPQRVPATASSSNGTTRSTSAKETTSKGRYGNVVNVTSLPTLQSQLKDASNTAVTIFFTSSTCAPCKVAYPMFDRLAEQHPSALFVKVDTNIAQDVASDYQIRATPTFMTFSRNTKQDQWSGADPNLLKSNVELLIRQTFPPHPHSQLDLPTLQFGSMKPVSYAKVPPLDKLMAKIGSPANSDSGLVAMRSFIEKREKSPADATLPDMGIVTRTFRSHVLSLPLETRFAAVDLLRCAMVDHRMSGYLAEEEGTSTVGSIISHVNSLDSTCPHNLRLVTLHLACNIFTSPLYVREIMKPGNATAGSLVQLITASLLDASHPTTRVASASLAFNLAVANYRMRREEGREGLGEVEQVELAASLVESLGRAEKDGDAMRALLLAVGYLGFYSLSGGELADLLSVVDAKGVVGGLKGMRVEGLVREVVQVL